MTEALGIATPTRAELARFDRSRKGKKTWQKEWQSPQDPHAKITKTKDGQTQLAHKFERFVRDEPLDRNRSIENDHDSESRNTSRVVPRPRVRFTCGVVRYDGEVIARFSDPNLNLSVARRIGRIQ